MKLIVHHHRDLVLAIDLGSQGAVAIPRVEEQLQIVTRGFQGTHTTYQVHKVTWGFVVNETGDALEETEVHLAVHRPGESPWH